MNKICTTIEQSQKLMELEIDVNTADMCWSIDIPDLPTLLAYPITCCDNLEYKIPAWSLTALLELIPNYVINKADDKIYANLYYGLKSSHDNLVDAAFEMLCQLKENKKL